MAPATGAGVTGRGGARRAAIGRADASPRLFAGLAAVAVAAPAAVAGTSLGAATVVLSALGLAALGGALVLRRVGLLAAALALLGLGYAAGLGAGFDAWAPLHAGALVAVAELADRSTRATGPSLRRIALTAAAATAVGAAALGLGALASHPPAAVRLVAIACAGAALVVAAGAAVIPAERGAGRRARSRARMP